MLHADSDKLYICPGEQHPISRAVHLARLAAFYPACRNCPLRGETGQLSRQVVERLQNTERRAERTSLFTSEGVRGVYLNEITRRKAESIAAAFAGVLWDEAPLLGRMEGATKLSRRSRPTVVLGHDERPCSPDIMTGASAGLRQMGCQVVDVGIVTRACFAFAVDHLQASAGVYVTGTGCDPSWTGFDFVGRGAMPLSQSSGLDDVEKRLSHVYNRPTRQAGTHRYFQASVPYEAGLWKHFHALRPLKIVCACPSRLVRDLLTRIFDTLPCRLVLVELPTRARNLLEADDADVQRVVGAVKKSQAALGVLIDDDGLRCSFVDEHGELVPVAAIARMLAELVLANHAGRTVVVDGEIAEEVQPAIVRAGGECTVTGGCDADIYVAMRDWKAAFGGASGGRFWFGESFPTCDAVLTIARMLDLLSRSDTTLSEVVTKAEQEPEIASLPVTAA